MEINVGLLSSFVRKRPFVRDDPGAVHPVKMGSRAAQFSEGRCRRRSREPKFK